MVELGCDNKTFKLVITIAIKVAGWERVRGKLVFNFLCLKQIFVAYRVTAHRLGHKYRGMEKLNGVTCK